jgi:hypothetical protein
MRYLGKQLVSSTQNVTLFSSNIFILSNFKFQSHQIFHVFVVAGAYVHYHGISKLASYRLTLGDCLAAHTETEFSVDF